MWSFSSAFYDYILWGLLAALTTTVAAPPEIVIIEDVGGPSMILSTGERTHHILPKAVQLVELKCQADYPVMWKDIDSIVYPGVIGAQSDRVVDVARFDQPNTYMYSMTLKWQLFGKEHENGTTLACLAAGAGQENYTFASELNKNTSTVLTIKWDRNLQAFICSLSSMTNSTTKIIGSLPDLTMSLDLSRYWSGGPAVMCCLRDGIHKEKYTEHIVIRYGQCSQPFLCITRNTTLKHTWSQQLDSSRRCGFGHFPLEVSKDSGYVLGVFTCELMGGAVKDWMGFRIAAMGEFSRLDYQSQLDNSKRRQWVRANANVNDPVTFYTRDSVLFRCRASTLYYSKGIVWELEFKNGTRQFIHASNEKAALSATMATANLSLSVHDVDVDSLIGLSCHIPPWNSTEWVTHSISMVVETSSAPSSPSGLSFSQENITFYTHDLAQLLCDLNGQPQPKFEWKIESSVYSSFVSRPRNLVRVSVNSQRWIKDPLIPRHSSETFSCTATNLAGNATKVFNVQAIQSFKPIFAKAARQAVVVYTGSRKAVLNCSLTQGVPAPHFVWQRNGEDISPDDNDTFQINTTDTWSVLLFKIVRLGDEAEYTCNSTNVLGSVTKEFSVRVRELPASPTPVPEPKQWSGLTITLLIIAIFLFVVLAFLWYRNHKKVAHLQARVEFASVRMEPFGSKVTLYTLTE